MYAKLTVAGRLPRDAELRSGGNAQVISFSLPLPQRLQSGEERTLWIECSYWRNPGESTEVVKYLKKGTVVLVEGVPYVRMYIRQDNSSGVVLGCRVNLLRILQYVSPPAEESVPVEVPEKAPEPAPDIPPLELSDEGDLPF
ncbi:MAG: single-stranded DNA-binding protein [Bacteroidia bacterium]